MAKHVTFNHYYMSSSLIALIYILKITGNKNYKLKKYKGNDGIGRHE